MAVISRHGDKPLTAPTTIRFCTRKELRDHSVTRWVDELRDEVTALEWQGQLVALSTVCPHFGGEMDVDRASGEIVCRWHAFRYGIEDGGCRSHTFTGRLRRYALEVDGDEVLIVRPEGR